jgi:signal transduction histidine kinase
MDRFGKSGEKRQTVKHRKPTRDAHPMFFALLAAGVLMVVLGLGALARVITRYEALVRDEYDAQMMDIAEAAERSAVATQRYYSELLAFRVGRGSFRNAQARWLDQGDADSMRTALQEIAQTMGKDVQCLVAVRAVDEQGVIELSSDGRGDYSWEEGEWSSGRSLLYCIDRAGVTYAAFVQRGEQASYAVLLPIEALYEAIAGEAGMAHDSHLYLLDTAAQRMIWRDENEIRVCRSADGQAACEEPDHNEGWAQLLECQTVGQPQTAYYATQNAQGQHYTAHLAAQPAEGEYNAFTIGVTRNYDEVLRPQQRVALQLIAFGILTACGILVLLGIIWRGRMRGRQHLRELAELREKNAQAEQLNQRLGELAHHQRLETIGVMTAGIAHEFNNLLTPIMGYSILVAEKLPPDATELQDSVQEIYAASCKAQTILRRLAALSRKSEAADFRPVSACALMRQVVDTARPAQPEGVQTRLEPGEGGAQALVWGDETQLTQLFLNLVLNAYQAMAEMDPADLTAQEKSLTITVAAPAMRKGADAQKQMVCFTLADTGPGIPPQIREKIFEPFFTTKQGGKGTGLGLAIARQVVEQHGGSIAVQQRPQGRGSVFVVCLPQAPEQENEIGKSRNS